MRDGDERTSGDRARVVVATHNIMHGRFLDRLIPHYRALAGEAGLDLLCVQENVPLAGDGAGDEDGDGAGDDTTADAIARALGPDYAAASADGAPKLALVYDSRTVRLLETTAVPLPALSALGWLERRYIRSGRPERRIAQRAVIAPASGAPVCMVNFHLDTAGDNGHRRAQVDTLAAALVAGVAAHPGAAGRILACGDTNAFGWTRRGQRALLADVIAPLADLGATDPGHAPTHFFARQREPLWTHRLCVALGAVGLDLPRRYDVACTGLPVTARGQVTTPGSDHDLVWVAVEA